MKSGRIKNFLANTDDLRVAAVPRSLFSNKSDNGRVLIIGGSAEYHGAPILASTSAYNTLAALRTGAGYAFLYVPQRIQDVARKLSPSLIVRSFGEENIGQGRLEGIKKEIESCDSLVIGMGIGREKSTLRAAEKLIDYALSKNKKIVIDADAIYAVKYLKRLNKNVVLTPQDREFKELSGKIPERYSEKTRIKAAASLAKKLNACILLKGHNTVVTDGKRVKIVSSKSSALATMGTGDVLSGIIGGYMATGNDAFTAAVAGAYLHSRIGDLLNKEKGNHILSSDLLGKIPEVLKKFDKNIR